MNTYDVLIVIQLLNIKHDALSPETMKRISLHKFAFDNNEQGSTNLFLLK